MYFVQNSMLCAKLGFKLVVVWTVARLYLSLSSLHIETSQNRYVMLYVEQL